MVAVVHGYARLNAGVHTRPVASGDAASPATPMATRSYAHVLRRNLELLGTDRVLPPLHDHSLRVGFFDDPFNGIEEEFLVIGEGPSDIGMETPGVHRYWLRRKFSDLNRARARGM